MLPASCLGVGAVGVDVDVAVAVGLDVAVEGHLLFRLLSPPPPPPLLLLLLLLLLLRVPLLVSGFLKFSPYFASSLTLIFHLSFVVPFFVSDVGLEGPSA